MAVITVAVVAVGGALAAADGILGGYAVGLLICVVFCAIGCGGGLMEVWLEERRK